MLLGCLLIASCSSQQEKPLPRFNSMAVATDPGVRLSLDETTQIQATRTTAKNGMMTGMALGIEGSAGCGIFVFVCLPVGIVAGGALGASIGGIAGAVKDSEHELPRAEMEDIITVIRDIEEHRDLSLELRNGLEQALPPGRSGHPDHAQGIIHVKIREIDLIQSQGTRLSIRLDALLVARWRGASTRTRMQRRTYACVIGPHTTEQWVAGKGAEIEAGFSLCIEQLVWDMNQSLTAQAGP